MKINKKDIEKILKGTDWDVEVVDNEIVFQIYNPEGQDFNIYIDSVNKFVDLADKIYEYAENFDISEETYLWLDNTGHGKNGAPYDIIDVYNDFKWCENEIYKLADIFYELREEEI